jgi:hypothetical protein
MKINRTFSCGTAVKLMEFFEKHAFEHFGLAVPTSWWLAVAYFPQGCAAFFMLFEDWHHGAFVTVVSKGEHWHPDAFIIVVWKAPQ